MTEQEFLVFMEGLWKKGRAQQVTMTMGTEGSQMHPAMGYITGHALLPKDYDKICLEDILKAAELLFKKEVKRQTKETIIMFLAHLPSKDALVILKKYNLDPDEGLEVFTQMALDECAMWNE